MLIDSSFYLLGGQVFPQQSQKKFRFSDFFLFDDLDHIPCTGYVVRFVIIILNYRIEFSHDITWEIVKIKGKHLHWNKSCHFFFDVLAEFEGKLKRVE